MTVGRRTFLVWRIIQFWTILNIFILEIVQISGFHSTYWLGPANNQNIIWVSEAISFVVIGLTLVNFNERWENGPFKTDTAFDWILFIVWNVQSFLNITPAIFGYGLNCSLGAIPYKITTFDGQTRCRLFIVSTALSYFALFTTVVTLMLSKSRWDNRELIQSSSRNRKLQAFYKVQKGSLDNGEPALFFYSRNTSPNSLHRTKLRNSIKHTLPPSSSPINISIPEPEMAAITKDSKETSIAINDEKNENEKDDSVLKY
ncbi:unnamed protein product [Rhizophagus irregularis]|uniref:Uncharacterized protein n=1 Tax=Rhizophagus irregularis TaxID=588596 RepID=A0A2I1EUJ5_9GLOM|nr:hypothetical protein RhiirB3_528144 [Rhizophagus irregularis]CAB4480014.1 unnamed protein product [Rhizophagus irregularis]CAB5190203.1 unnamed protein product [Rhizophagus irregularis]CAB5395949.1 unnamed protein product [Rhizophagus irregularis]